ncbi:MAG TPA: hypothetical protein VFT22_26350 [Kofleriaceae bacterium]|nr:hypothetical protein [Kofleriaceae bacterium]
MPVIAHKERELARPEIHKVNGVAQREQVYRFWYDTYVAEMRRSVKDADHERRRLTDSLEDHSTIFAAYEGPAILGTIRVNLSSMGSLSYYDELYGLDACKPDRDPVAIATKFMVKSRYRGTPLGYELASAGLAECVRGSAVAVYMDCNEYLFGYFSTLGFECVRSAVHPEFGSVRVMKYDLSDPERRRGFLGTDPRAGS